MLDGKDRVVLKEMGTRDMLVKKSINNHCKKLIEKGKCPTCEHFKNNNVFKGQEKRTFYEDDQVVCLLEKYARGVGHTIILSKKHYEDISEMPKELGYHIVDVSEAVIKALKELIGAKKVYMVTMCSDKISHLHFQLIPRLEGDVLGSKVLSSQRKVMKNFEPLLEQLKIKVPQNLHN